MMSDQIEQLTEEERLLLPVFARRIGPKALRIIDAHAATRAASAARVAELERQCDEHVQGWTQMNERRAAAESEVARLREALAAAERLRDTHHEAHVSAEQRGLAAEDRVRELEYANGQRQLVIDAIERKLAAANALLGQIPDCLLTDCPVYERLMAYKRAHLSAQLTAPAELDRNARVHNDESLFLEAQAALDTEHRLACEWKAAAEQYRLEAETTKDALHALRTRVDRAVEHFALAYGSSPYHWPEAVRSALEVLRRSQQ